MRVTILMTIAIFWLTLQFNQCIQLLRPGSDGKPICTQRPVTQAELDAAMAQREELLRDQGLLPTTRPAVTPAVASLDPDFPDVYAE